VVIYRRVSPVRPEPEPVSPNDRLPDSRLDLPYTTTVYATFGCRDELGRLRTLRWSCAAPPELARTELATSVPPIP